MITGATAHAGYVSLDMNKNQGPGDTNSNFTLPENIKTLNNNGCASTSSLVCKAAKYALTAGVGVLAVASVTYVATHGFFTIDLGTGRGNSASMEAKGTIGLEIINQLNQGRTPDQIPPSFYKG